MPGDQHLLSAAYSVDIQDPHATPPTQQDKVVITCGMRTISINCKQFVESYNDGSRKNGISRKLARDGWGVYYGEGSEYNTAKTLEVRVQTL